MKIIMDELTEIIKRRSSPGILIFDTNNILLYSNEEALEMIPELQQAIHNIPKEIDSLLNHLKSKSKKDSCYVDLNYTVIKNETAAPCAVRAFFIGSHEKNYKHSHIMVLLEKIVKKRLLNFDKIKNEFNLSNREIEVTKLICDGLSNKEIGEKLFICEYTVKDHIKNIMRKLNVPSRNGIIAFLM